MKFTPENIKKYEEICKCFATESSEWNRLDNLTFYTTASHSYKGWKETSDNAHGGIDVSWAFHLKPEEIESRAAEELLKSLLDEFQAAVSDGWELEEFESLYHKYNDIQDLLDS